MKPFFLSADARRDVDGIWNYLIEHATPAVADRIMNNIYKAIQKLADNPQLGHFRPDLTSAPVRFYLVYSYYIIYHAEVTPLGIVRVLHSARDIPPLLQSDSQP